MNSTVGFAAHFGLLESQETDVSQMYLLLFSIMCYCYFS